MPRFNVILSDPPWKYSDSASAGKRGAVHKYKDMTDARIMKLPVHAIAADDCALFLWATMPKLPVALDVMKSWGFEYKTVAFVWAKSTKNGKWHWGMGNWSRACAEIVLLGIKGNPKRKSASVHSLVTDPFLRSEPHSRKPDEVRKRIVQLMGDVSRCEMFATEQVEGWTCLGNQIDGQDIEDAIWKLVGKKSGKKRLRKFFQKKLTTGIDKREKPG